MPQNLPTMLSVLAGVVVFVVVVFWPSRTGRPPEPPADSGVQLASMGEAARQRRDTAPDRAGPVTTRQAATRPRTWHRPRFDEFRSERERMVKRTISHPWDGRQRIVDPQVLSAMREAPRHLLVESRERRSAHADHPLPIGYGQTISQPYIVALMTEALRLRPGAKVLEIGTGSGYQAVVLSELTPNVYTIEIVKPLYERTSARLAKLGYKTIRCKHGDGYFGWPDHMPFGGIIVTCAAGHVPPPLFEQLAPGGRMVIPVGQPGMYQQLKVITKDVKTSKPRYETICGVAFVPMTGRIAKP
jgi:protein-L-isoaspartate(D-aspartate) O-methyltransferase